MDGTRDGLALPAEKREKLTALKKELSQLCLEFEVSILGAASLHEPVLIDRKKNVNEENVARPLFYLEKIDVNKHSRATLHSQRKNSQVSPRALCPDISSVARMAKKCMT